MIPSSDSFWRGSDKADRREKYSTEYEARADLLEANGADTRRRIDAAVLAFEGDTGLSLPGIYSSGWRPSAVNDATANAGKLSTHKDADAGDVKDLPEGEFAWWCFAHQHVLEQLGLWMEHPVATVLLAKETPWCHLQRLAPNSHARIYFPTTASAEAWSKYVEAGGEPHGGPLALRKPVVVSKAAHTVESRANEGFQADPGKIDGAGDPGGQGSA